MTPPPALRLTPPPLHPGVRHSIVRSTIPSFCLSLNLLAQFALIQFSRSISPHSFCSLNLLSFNLLAQYALNQFGRSICSRSICSLVLVASNWCMSPFLPLLRPGARCAATTGDSGRPLRCSPSRRSSTRTPSCSLGLCASSAKGRTTPDPGTVWRWPPPRRRRGRWRARPSAWWVLFVTVFIFIFLWPYSVSCVRFSCLYDFLVFGFCWV